TLVGTLPTGGNGTTYAYLWEVATSASGTFSSASASTINYTPGALTASRWYRRRVTSGVCAVSYSDTVQVTVTPVIGTNTITASQTICTGSSPSFTGSVATGGNGTYAYSWESSTTSSSTGFSPVPGANSQNFTSGPLTVNTWFRRRVDSDVCFSNSGAVAITIHQPVLNNDIFSPQSICGATAPDTLKGTVPTGGTGALGYLWEVATTSGGPFSSASVSTPFYKPGVLTASRWYRRRVTAGVCPANYSDTIEITVTPAIATNTISASQTICTGFTPASFTGSLPTGGTGVYTFEWESSTTSATTGFSPIASSNVQSYASGALTVNTWFRRKVYSGPLCVATSGAVAITINQPTANNDISAPQSICANTVPAQLTGTLPTGGTGTYSYLWEASTSASGTFNSQGVSTINYSPAALTSSRWYRRRLISGACPANYSDTIAVLVTPAITANTISASQNVCFSSVPNPLTGSIPAGAVGGFTYEWESSTTSATTGFSVLSGETGQGLVLSPVGDTTWYRRIAYSGVCTSRSTAIQITPSPSPTVDAGPAMADIVQGGISAALGGSFGGSATGAVWSAPEGVFASNSGPTPGTATYTASPISAPVITLTLTSTGSVCPAVSATKTINVVPDPFGITGVINQYAEVVAPSSLSAGALKCTLATGQGTYFAKNDRALIIQMKGATISLPGSPTDITYGYITGMGNSGNNEFVNVDSVAGDVVFFKRCTKKSYTISGSVQLIRVPQYTGNYNVKTSSAVSAVRLTRKGMGYPPNTTITSGFTVTPVQGGAGLILQAKSDALGQINEIEVLDGGAGYLKPPIITLPDPTVAPFDLPAYKAKALAVMGLTGKQWNGKTGGVLCFEVDGNIVMSDSIHMTGMGFAGGMIGDKGDIAPTCGASAEYALNFSSYMRAGQKGEGITTIPVSAMRGKGRYATGGGGGVEPEGGGGGGANWQDGGRGGSSSYIVITNSACSTTVTPCDKDVLRGGLGAGTNPTTPVGFKNVLRSNSYYYQPALNRIFLGGGGGGGHAFNEFAGMQSGGAGGYGGGIVILKAEQLTSNNHEILATGENGENADGDGAGGGGAGGAVLLFVNNFVDGVNGRVNGGNGGSAIPAICELSVDEQAYPSRKRYSGAGGGGGGGVVWFTQLDEDVNLLAVDCNLGQSSQGTNGDGFNNTAQKGGSARSQSELVAIENIPLIGSVFTVGGSGATFPNLQKAAEFLAFKGTDAPAVTLQVTNNTSNPANLLWYKAPATFSRIYTGGCTFGDATVTIQPKTTANSVNLQNEMDDLAFITLDGIPSVTIKNMLISGSYDYINTSVVVKGGSTLYLENVNATADIKSDAVGTNDIYVKNTTHTGGIEVGSNQNLYMEGTINMNGIALSSPSLKFWTGSTLHLPAGSILNLNGASWINNGATTFNIDPASEINFGGAFTNVAIGGTTPTTFQKLNVTSTGGITTTSNNTVYDWNQTGSATVSTGSKILTISGKVKTSAGKFISTGAGRVSLAGVAAVDVEGRYGNLEINSANHANLTGAVTVDNTLILTDGKLNPSGFSLTIENTAGSAVVNSPTSWVAGPLKRKVATGNSYYFPVGVNTLEKSLVNVTSVAGLQYLTCSFKANDPMAHPLASIVNPYQDGPAYFSSLSPEGYWNITPDAGTATYDMWLFPSFYGLFPQYSIYKRPTASNEWSIFGSLNNPENTVNYVQADGSVRRTGLTGFSDFALAGGEEPLPLNFLDFRVSQRRGIGKLNWKMADCLKEGKFTIFRGTSTSTMEKVGTLVVNESDCQNDFAAEDILPGNGHKFYYQISASARDEKTVVSPIKMISLGESGAEKPFLAVMHNDPWRFQIMSENIDETGINIVSVDGKTVASNLKAENKILDLRSIPKGVYLVEMVNSGWSVRQRVVVGL
nr:T9SS type A sorting domain-containing protein [Catalimonadaceae bacterium]